MKNQIFDISFHKENGGVEKLTFVNDPAQMNFCRSGRTLFSLRQYELLSIEETEESAVITCAFQGIKSVTKYTFDGEDLVVSTRLTNENKYPMYYRNGDLCLSVAFNDAYESSIVSERERCHTHIWAGLENSYVRAERMGESEYNLGLVFEQGSFVSYTQEECTDNWRGYLSLNGEGFVLKSGESYELQYRIFRHAGREDFFEKAKKCEGFLQVQSEGYTVEKGADIVFSVLTNQPIKSAQCTVRQIPAPCKIERDKVIVRFCPSDFGEYEFIFTINGKRGKAVFNVVPDRETHIKTRIDFILDKQQCLDKESPLFGAYLIYDNEEERCYFDYTILDLNANRERMGMSLMIAKWLQKHDDERVRKSLELFTEFLLRECVNEEQGTCYGNIGKDESYLRLYNAPWVMLYFTELYNLTGEKRWIELVVRIIRYYYSVGGAKFYPNGLRFYTMYKALKKAGMEKEIKEVCALFDEHVQTVVKNGVVYPPHEVNFEQTIVSPCVTILMDKYFISKDEFYLREAEKHVKLLHKFDGMQPHYRLHTISIRFWDDFFFGKRGCFGDVCPHYWSVLSGYGYYLYGKATGDQKSLLQAKNCMENCLCNIYPNGRATCAYIFPAWVGGKAHFSGRQTNWDPGFQKERKGSFADAFANDQDFGTYFLLKMEYDE